MSLKQYKYAKNTINVYIYIYEIYENTIIISYFL